MVTALIEYLIVLLDYIDRKTMGGPGLVWRGQTVFAPRAENGLGNDVTSFCSGYPRNFWEINEARKGVNIVARIPMVSSITCNNHMERTMTQWLYITDHRFINTFMCFINFPEIPWVVRTKTYNVVPQTVFCENGLATRD